MGNRDRPRFFDQVGHQTTMHLLEIYNFRMGRFSGMEISSSQGLIIEDFSTRGMKKFQYLKITAHSEIRFLFSSAMMISRIFL